MSRKYALVIGNTQYTDSGLAQLTAPGKDAEDFAQVLRDPDLGAFDSVRVVVNEQSSSAIEAIDEFFDQKKPDDLLVLYFSGHGVKDEMGSLYLAFRNTVRTRLRSTAIKSDYIREAMDQSRSKRQVVILDCCNSGAFPPGTKAELGGAMGMTQAFQGYGRFVLTASDATQFAWEGDRVIGETKNSLFTHFLVKGLQGEADSDGDGRITVDELYDFAFEQISRVTPNQTPTKSSSKVEGEIVLRQFKRIKDIKPMPLPEDLVSEMEDLRPYVREEAVKKLDKILKGRNIGMARSAVEALEKIVADENTTRRVAQAAQQALDGFYELERKAEEERQSIIRVEEERQEREKAEAERKAKEAKRLEQIQAEQEAARLRDEKEAEEKTAIQKAEREAIVLASRKKAEQEQAAKAEREAMELDARKKADREAKERIDGSQAGTTRPKPARQPPIVKWAMIGILGLCIVGTGALGIYYLPRLMPETETPATTQFSSTEAPTGSQPSTEVPVVEGPPDDPNALPRNKTLYFNGQQWGAVICWNPYSSSCNNEMAIAQQDNARVTMFETPYLYNMLDGKQYPLLADGDYEWNNAKTEVTFKIKKAAHWSDGTPVIAEDVAYTWATHVKYNTTTAIANQDYIDTIEAIDDQTVVIKAKLGEDGKAVNPLLVNAYLSANYVIQKAWTQNLERRVSGDTSMFIHDAAEDVVYSGPYGRYFVDDSKVILIRNDSYWGQDASMWGKLPMPRYLVHVFYEDNKAGTAALEAGEVDVSQQFNANVQDLWIKQDLPISTYLPEAPYGIGASLPTAFFNLKSPGLDQVAIRKAIAMAVDYPTIIANAMTNQSATFDQVPRSLMNPTPGEQALYDQAAVADLQWAGNDIEGAKALLDEAGVVDSDGDGWREFNGQKLSYVATCPNGWSDWQAAIEVVAAAGKKIGIDITTNYPEWGVYQTVVTKSDAALPEGYDIFMMWSDGAGPTQPWSRIRHMLSSEFVGMPVNWNGNWGQYSNPAADELIKAIPTETDEAKLKEMYTELVKIYLTDVPSFTLMYRPQNFHAVNESVWTNFPHEGDGTNPPVPPLDLTDGWSVAGLYNLELVAP